MSKLLSALIVAVSLSLAFSPSLVRAHQEPLQDSAVIFQILAGINTARIANGLTPYALNPLLTQAAQTQSEYQRDTGQVSHDGPGGNRALDRVLATGYPAVRANENIYAGMGGPNQAVNWWLGSTAGHVQNILHAAMREVGIGAALNADGLTYYTVVFSAQPNVLPAFMNNDAYSTSDPSVVLALTNEEIFSGGAGQIGRAVQVQISNTSDFANAVVMPWAQYVSWTLDTSTGDGFKVVHVRYVDAAGRSADSQDSIVLDTAGGVVIVVPTLMPGAMPPTAAVIPQPTVVAPQLTAVPAATVTSSPTSLPTQATTAITPSPTRYISRTPIPLTPTVVAVARPVTVLGIPAGVIRAVLWGALGLGLVCIVLGNLTLIRSRRPMLADPEEEDSGDD
jgi:uncharacterized protein YkwD